MLVQNALVSTVNYVSTNGSKPIFKNVFALFGEREENTSLTNCLFSFLYLSLFLICDGVAMVTPVTSPHCYAVVSCDSVIRTNRVVI